MTAQPSPALTITTRNAERLEALLSATSSRESPVVALLEAELLRATLVEPESIAADIVTMNSRAVCVDEDSGETMEIELVYPHEVDAERGRVSVLAPVGAALLGLSVGSSISWPIPGGRLTRLRVTAVPFQPEADARLH